MTINTGSSSGTYGELCYLWSMDFLNSVYPFSMEIYIMGIFLQLPPQSKAKQLGRVIVTIYWNKSPVWIRPTGLNVTVSSDGYFIFLSLYNSKKPLMLRVWSDLAHLWDQKLSTITLSPGLVMCWPGGGGLVLVIFKTTIYTVVTPRKKRLKLYKCTALHEVKGTVAWDGFLA